MDFKGYKILAACNPSFACEALKLEEKNDTTLPCNVVVLEQAYSKIKVGYRSHGVVGHGWKPALTVITGQVQGKLEPWKAGVLKSL